VTPDVRARVDWYRRMLEIRLFEEKVQELFMQGLIQGTTHLCQGQEAVPVGAISALRDDDYLTITYRGHGHALMRGVSMEACFAELMGRSSGCCKGVGATNIGTFHESLNIAATWKVGVIFIVENNLYGEYTPLRETTPVDDLAERAKGFAIPGIVVDGQDVDTVHAAVAAAIARARGGDGPSLLEMKTYRFRGHSRTDPARYRPEGELARWQERDPIPILGRKLAADGALAEEQQAAIREEAQTLVDSAAERAKEAPFPTLEEIQSYVYAA
jgi:TPP-dependent pyruvate/acetoin dehydrogenase alpha subunit